MPDSSKKTATALLQALQEGDQMAFDELFQLVYEELHDQAHRQRQRWRGDYTLNTTALVHEAYLKLVDQRQADWKTKSHFFATAAKAMRHILINYAKRCRRQKRGGDRAKLSLEEAKASLGEAMVSLSEEQAETLVMLDVALKRLEAVNARQSRIVECRFFGGMTIQETATALGVSPMTVKRGWSVAKLWLYREMQGPRSGAS